MKVILSDEPEIVTFVLSNAQQVSVSKVTGENLQLDQTKCSTSLKHLQCRANIDTQFLFSHHQEFQRSMMFLPF